ncbi:MAG: hypothetical protein Q8N88_01580 [Nanoarchaeota archaeon]|nr:hypothetical protein [Nanoarchaeota archaeon]
MKIKTFCKIVLLHIFFFIVGTAFYILLFHTTLFKNIDVLFYRGIALLIVSSAFLSLIMILYKKMGRNTLFTYRDIILSITLFSSINLVFFTHLPVTAERSISVFLLGYLNEHSETVFTDKEITNIFTDKYLYEYDAIGKRLYEQLTSRNIVRSNNSYKI